MLQDSSENENTSYIDTQASKRLTLAAGGVWQAICYLQQIHFQPNAGVPVTNTVHGMLYCGSSPYP